MLTFPYKSPAAAIVLAAILGPIGLLYANFWAGFFMIFIGLVVISAKMLFPAILIWLASCIWAAAASEHYNRKIWLNFNQK